MAEFPNTKIWEIQIFDKAYVDKLFSIGMVFSIMFRVVWKKNNEWVVKEGKGKQITLWTIHGPYNDNVFWFLTDF